MKKLREQGVVEISTRSVTEINCLTELQEVGRIDLEPTASGVWTCRLKEDTPKQS